MPASISGWSRVYRPQGRYNASIRSGLVKTHPTTQNPVMPKASGFPADRGWSCQVSTRGDR